MKVVVTGASGFVGGHVVDNLLERGIDVIAFDRLHKGELLRPGVYRFLGDTRDETAVAEAVAVSDGVIHLAGVLGTSETIDNPLPAVETNIRGCLNVFQAVRQYHKRAVYITVGNYWFNNTYSITKTTAENLAWMFNREHGTKIAVVRALNAYGPRQKAAPVRKIMPNFIGQALMGEPITVYGDGEQVMDMIHVRDVADVLVRALLVNHGQYSYLPERNIDNHMKFEAGTGRPTTVNDVANIVLDEVAKIDGQPRGAIVHVEMRGGEPPRSVVIGDPSTLDVLWSGSRTDLDGRVLVATRSDRLITLEDGVRESVQWYRNQMMAASLAAVQ
jgi:nucleoside-diphosphate-sugar epimerase